MSVEDSPTSATDDVVAHEAEEQSSESALRDNISKKGKNAYYYAHAHKADGPKWDGKIEPRLLSTSSSNVSSASSGGGLASSSSKASLMAKSNITNYAFLDEDSKVKIYVNLPGVGDCDDGNIALEYTARTLCLTIKNYVTPAAKKEKEVVDELMVADTAPEEKEDGGEGGEEEMRVGEDRCLSFGQLFREIEKATLKKKPDKVILTLKKKENKPWTSVIG